jgi:uncharacterized protein with ATP-grasp and redox domains
MSRQESYFLKWIGGIVAVLISGILIQAFVLLSTIDVIEIKIKQNEKSIVDTQNANEKDVRILYDYIGEIQTDQIIIKADIKELLKK